jgi:hypothetical protein
MHVESAQDPAVDLTAVDRELTGRGYESASSGEGQLVLIYHVGLDGAMDIQMINTLPEDRWGIDRGWVFYTERSVRTLEQGTLVLDAYNADTGLLIWRGVAQAEIDRTQSPEKRAELVDKAVRRLIQEFPPRASS